MQSSKPERPGGNKPEGIVHSKRQELGGIRGLFKNIKGPGGGHKVSESRCQCFPMIIQIIQKIQIIQ